MKKLIVLAVLVCGSPALARGGSGGTSGGNPKPVLATPFNADPVRAKKLKEAVAILHERIPKSCFPKDYNQAMIAELDRLIESQQIFYFPQNVMLGYDRYDGDYGTRVLPDGTHQFFEVGAFTSKVKGQPIYFTRDSDKYDAEELAMTFAQDLNDHVLQWNREADLNQVGAMLTGQEKCQYLTYSTNSVFAQFPVSEPLFAIRQAEFIASLQQKIKTDGKMRFGSIPDGFEIDAISPTPYGFTFTPKGYYYWTSGPEYNRTTIKNPRPFEVVLNPFRIERPSDHVISGLVRDIESGVIISEFVYSPADKQGLNMDPLCSYREFESNDSIRHRLDESGGRFSAHDSCSVNIEAGTMDLSILRPRTEVCKESRSLDYFNKVKAIDDQTFEIYCDYFRTPREFSLVEYQHIVGSQAPETFVKKLIQLNEMHYRELNDLPPSAQLPWISKNILGGRVSVLPEALSVIRDSTGDVYSVYVAINGVYIINTEVEDLDDDDDVAFQCFFKGPQAGKCARRNYDD